MWKQGEDKLNSFKKLHQQNIQEKGKMEEKYQKSQINLGRVQAAVKLQPGKTNPYQHK